MFRNANAQRFDLFQDPFAQQALVDPLGKIPRQTDLIRRPDGLNAVLSFLRLHNCGLDLRISFPLQNRPRMLRRSNVEMTFEEQIAKSRTFSFRGDAPGDGGLRASIVRSESSALWRDHCQKV
jgi:hypothetical protein